MKQKEWPCQHVDFAPFQAIPDFWPSELQENNTCCFKPPHTLLQQSQETKAPCLYEGHSHEIWKIEENSSHYHSSSRHRGFGSDFQYFSAISPSFMLTPLTLGVCNSSKYLMSRNLSAFHEFHQILSFFN